MKRKIDQSRKRIAIIGCGPRGLYALECLLQQLSEQSVLKIPSVLIFDDSKDLGAGHVWKINQNDANWINISIQHLSELKGRHSMEIEGIEIPKFPSFNEWAEQYNFYKKTKILTFPPRSVMGRYLSERLESIINTLLELQIVAVHKERIISALPVEKSVVLESSTKITYTVDECLLTVGHQPVSMSEETKRWQLLANKFDLIFVKNPYNEKLLDEIDPKSIAIRGMGLAMIDVVRAFAFKFGNFIEIEDSPFYAYKSKYSHPFYIIPYSPDGLPPVPKPYTTAIDNIFDPGKEIKLSFKKKVEFLIQSLKDESFIEEFLSVIAEISTDLYIQKNEFFRKSTKSKSEIRKIVFAWLKNMNHKDELILDTDLACKSYMEQTVLMAHNATEISLDFVVMQVWRHLQPTMYAIFSHCDLPDGIMEKVVELDENSKRYTFGPPVGSIKQLIALSDKGILDFTFAKDPSVEITAQGWMIRSNSSSTNAKVMIDSVLGSPLAKDITSPIFNDLIEKRIITPVSANLGFKTSVDARIYTIDNTLNNSLCMIGRYCKGSVLGVDAILECFGRDAEAWSKSLIKRLA